MSLGFDMDGEPILTEEEERDEFVEIICASCNVDGEETHKFSKLFYDR
jgi:hypothetical protein